MNGVKTQNWKEIILYIQANHTEQMSYESVKLNPAEKGTRQETFSHKVLGDPLIIPKSATAALPYLLI